MRSSRRRVLAAVGSGLAVATVGCTDDSGQSRGGPPEGTDILVGPGSRLEFEPDRLTVQAGTTVTWYFSSGGHNVSCRPNHSSTVSLPESAAPFASYGTNESMRSTEPSGGTYTRRLEVPGEYVYVCIPHAKIGMRGTIRVE